MRDPRIAVARAAIGRGEADTARQIGLALADASADADAAEGLFLAGIADAMEGRVSAAADGIAAAIDRHPTALYHAQLARLLSMLLRDGEAGAAALAAEALGPTDALTYDTIGCVQARLGDHEAALRSFTPAVALEPDNIQFRTNLALALGFVGRVEDAAEQYEAILAREPANGQAHFSLAGLAKATPAANHVERMEAVLARGVADDDALRIRYAAAKEYEDLGQAAPAFRHLDAANRAHKARSGYDFARDAAIFDAIEQGFRDPDYLAGPGHDGADPIFIVGMPRTGTTLVDRILSSHAMVHSAGELQAMPVALKMLAGTKSRVVLDPATVFAIGELAPDDVGVAYAARADLHRRRPDGRFIDKLPTNFFNIGAIARALPRASIVCLRRHPMDTVWSNYKHLFATTSAFYAYSHDLMDTARYFARFDRLIAYWAALFPGRILQLSYEQLVADQEGESRRLFAHCGLDWTPTALDFHTNTAAVATPSAAQVRRPMYKDSVARWRAHEEAMAPVAAYFAEAGIAID
ncbi:sulfotransferase [Sandarakinorhabdus sp. DWP1-3-1]|uniref:sulfotransferase family protein n=1 Tax=Sandarakinorhabdus sp. DWP1-3-1 TaxID=2804627 RepID=UPI003CE8B64F